MNVVLGALALAIGVLLLLLHSKKLVSVVVAPWSGGDRDRALGDAGEYKAQLVAFAIVRSVVWLS
ncbi:MAG: hypothetical protein K2X42_07705, partial [Burkholderiaceae bacterium]|nr:hypothetical protein [Burkholderiaceae bacterium]